MSLPKSKRSENDLLVLTKAKVLSAHTIKLCANENNFPKKYRWCLTQQIVQTSLNIQRYIRKANSINVKYRSDYELRSQFQAEAAGELFALNDLIDTVMVARDMFPIKESSLTNWLSMIDEVDKMLENWTKKDFDRYSQLDS